jgi:fermentation-respiration switch protein FrsA (DUF1100 family)
VGCRLPILSGCAVFGSAVVLSAQLASPPGQATAPSSARAKAAAVVPIWPEGVPGLLTTAGPEAEVDARVSNVHTPTLTVHGGTDQAVPPENNVLFYSALRRAGVSAELHIYQEGAHGVGLEPNHGPVSEWPKRCAEWLGVRGLLARGPRP